ncbi:MAG TPA: copper resistance protein CopC [Conexibacter sp.]|nr:copper resistance protein CopC [Conexibacter sp.]
MSAGRTHVRLAAALAAGALLLAPSAALAHAQLQDTSPQRGAVVRTQPAQVSFRFDEAVEGTFGAVRVYDGTGRRVDAGDAFHPGGRGPVMAVHLKPQLPAGTYTATYRVVSADGHIVSSGFVFSIGHPSATRQTVGQLIGAGGSGPVTETAFGLARGLQYLAIALALGALAFLLAVWRPALRELAGSGEEWRSASEAFARRLRGLLLGAAALGALSAAAGVVLEGAEAAGLSGFDALRARIVRETLGTRFGTVWGIGAVSWLLVGALGWAALRPRGVAAALRPARVGTDGLPPLALLAALAAPCAFLLVLPAFSGHATTQHPVAVLAPANVVHVAAVSLWVGGLALLALALPAATRHLELADRGRLLAGTLARFSPLALAAVVAIAATGIVQGYVLRRTPAHLLDTAFGRAVLIKALLLCALVALGAYQRRRSLPALRRIAADGAPLGRAGVLVRRALRAELALAVVVLGVTAALTSYPPSTFAQSGPVSKTTRIGPAQLELTLDPARVGANELHLYLLNPQDGTQYTRAQEVDVAESQPSRSIGPLNQAANLAGPGHYIVPDALLGVPGTWRIQVTVRVSDFTEYLATVEVPVR